MYIYTHITRCIYCRIVNVLRSKRDKDSEEEARRGKEGGREERKGMKKLEVEEEAESVKRSSNSISKCRSTTGGRNIRNMSNNSCRITLYRGMQKTSR